MFNGSATIYEENGTFEGEDSGERKLQYIREGKGEIVNGLREARWSDYFDYQWSKMLNVFDYHIGEVKAVGYLGDPGDAAIDVAGAELEQRENSKGSAIMGMTGLSGYHGNECDGGTELYPY